MLSIISFGGIFLIVYADILFVLNFFITYLLLMLTKALTKSTAKTIRMLLGAFIGAVYSLVIFIPGLNVITTVLGRLGVSLLIVFFSFGFVRASVFLKKTICFYFSNLVFLGVILAIWLSFKPKGIFINLSLIHI